MDDFNRTDVDAVHRAMIDADARAEERREKMPSSSEAIKRHAKDLEDVREKILDRLPPEVRQTYPKRSGSRTKDCSL